MDYNKVKVYDEIWVAKKDPAILNRYSSRRPEDLAYMCHKQDNKAFENRRETGTRWAKEYGRKQQTQTYSNGTTRTYEVTDLNVVYPAVENTYTNEPLAGFTFGKSTSRWSTSKKFVYVTDPRGFTVEMSTSCLAALLQRVTVVKGVIQDKCIWGRDGKDNVLVPEKREE